MRLLAVSLAVNAATGVALVAAIHRRGWTRTAQRVGLLPVPPPDYAALAAARFGGQRGAKTVVWGDSHAQNAPLLEMLTPVRQWAIGGQTIGQLSTWIDRVAAARPERVVLVAGTNDILLGATAEQVAARLAAVRGDLVARVPGVEVVSVTIPPLRGFEAIAAEVSAHLRTLRPVVDVHAALSGPDGRWLPGACESDGVHISPEGYRMLGVVLG